jgi:hypothetical protein
MNKYSRLITSILISATASVCAETLEFKTGVDNTPDITSSALLSATNNPNCFYIADVTGTVINIIKKSCVDEQGKSVETDVNLKVSTDKSHIISGYKITI